MSKYAAHNSALNRVQAPGIAQLSVKTGTSVDLKFEFVDSNNERVNMDPFVVAFLDLDGGFGGGMESIKVDAATSYKLSTDSEVMAEHIEGGSMVEFSAS